MKFPIVSECTSLKVSPTGRLVVGGFADGTVRLFSTTTPTALAPKNTTTSSSSSSPSPDASFPTSISLPTKKKKTKTKNKGVMSLSFSHNKNVAAHIVSKGGVHTSLLLNVDVSQDGLWAFAGALRGSMELVAIHLGHVEEWFDHNKSDDNTQSPTRIVPSSQRSLMNALTVYKRADAKLRGFGACTRILSHPNAHDDHDIDNDRRRRPRYLLLTGKGIKNIHIWSFEPPTNRCSSNNTNNSIVEDEPIWTQLYDTQTNGNTIKWLSFHWNSTQNTWSALSQSDGQKLRVWDLSHEQQSTNDTSHAQDDGERPSRPPFVDVNHTEGMLGVAGRYVVCGGARESMYHKVSLVDLDGGDLTSPYNHTELALPTAHGGSSNVNGRDHHHRDDDNAAAAPPLSILDTVREASFARRPRRQQRGDLKSVEHVAGMSTDAGQALLELSDGQLVQFQSVPSRHGVPQLLVLSGQSLSPGCSRQVCVARVASMGLAVAATAVFHPAHGKGILRLWALDDLTERQKHPFDGFWGFRGTPTLPAPTRKATSHPTASPYQRPCGTEPASAIKVLACTAAESSTAATASAPGSAHRHPECHLTSAEKPHPFTTHTSRSLQSIVTPRFGETVRRSPTSTEPPSLVATSFGPDSASTRRLSASSVQSADAKHVRRPNHNDRLVELLHAASRTTSPTPFDPTQSSPPCDTDAPSLVRPAIAFDAAPQPVLPRKRKHRSRDTGNGTKVLKSASASVPTADRRYNAAEKSTGPATTDKPPSPQVPRKGSISQPCSRRSSHASDAGSNHGTDDASWRSKEIFEQQNGRIARVAHRFSLEPGPSAAIAPTHDTIPRDPIEGGSTRKRGIKKRTLRSSLTPRGASGPTPTHRPAPNDSLGIASFKSPPRRDKRRHSKNPSAAIRAQVVAECDRQKAKLQQMLQAHRDKCRDEAAAAVPVLRVARRTLADRQVRQRQQYSAELRAIRDRVARAILQGTYHILESIRRSPTPSSISEAKDFWNKTIPFYLVAMVGAQAFMRVHWFLDYYTPI